MIGCMGEGAPSPYHLHYFLKRGRSFGPSLPHSHFYLCQSNVMAGKIGAVLTF